MSLEMDSHFRMEFFSCANLIFLVFDNSFNCVDASIGFTNSFNIKYEDCIGKNISNSMFSFLTKERLKIFETLNVSGGLIIDDNFVTPSNSNLHYRTKILKLETGIGIEIINITDLIESRKELETFIFKFSHDMRAPLASVLGLLSLLESEDIKKSDTKNIHTMIHQQIIQMESKLRIMVDSTRQRVEEKNIHTINFSKIVDAIEKTLEWMVGYGSIKIERKIQTKKEFYSDENLISSLFQNIIENAIKYQRENVNSFLVISISDEKDGVLITFTDNGIGIPANLQDDVFKMFFRATETSEGSGLGLYTVKHTVKKLNGEIKLESKEGMGTKFIISLPNLKNEN